MPRSSKRVELKMGNGNGMLAANLGVVWKLLRPSWCPHPHASLIEEVTERVRLAPAEDEDHIEHSAQTDPASGEGVK